MRISQTKVLLKQLAPTREPVLLVSPPGIGKTSLCMQVCEELKYKNILFHPILDDRVDYKGLPAIVDGGAEFLPFGNLKKLVHMDVPCMVTLDDVGQAPTDVQAALMQLVLAREVNGQAISPLVWFVAASNRKKDKAGVTGLISPLLDRFIAVIDVEFNIDDWAGWMTKQAFAPEIIAYVRMKPKLVVESVPSGEMEKRPTPRTLAGVGRLLKLGISDFDSIAAAAGKAWAGEFIAFRNVMTEIPRAEDIFADPKKAKIPTRADILYALMASLAYHTEAEKCGDLMQYLSRVSPEYAVVCLKDLVSKGPKITTALQTNKDYSKWVEKNYNIFVQE